MQIPKIVLFAMVALANGAVLSSAPLALAADSAPEPTWEQTLDKASKAVVSLRVRATRDFDTERARGSTGTGFVIDKERGILLTNRHMVHTGPVIAEAVFLNHEEVELQPIYRDPVHDFGFYRFDPKDVRFMDLVELPLHPEKAKVGLQIRVIGNDSGEKISILDGTLARLDRAAPSYGSNTYNDFNTFYYQAASNTSGGSSGSPVVLRSGEVIALNAGSRTSTASAFYLPLDRIVRAVPYIERGEVPPRGTVQATFSYTPYDEVRRLGVQTSTEASARTAFKNATGMMVVAGTVPGGPAHSKLRPGDVLVSLQGQPIADFIGIESVLDESVGQSVALGIERGGEPMQVSLKVADLHAISPASYLEVGRGVFNETSYMQARNHNIPVAGVYVAQSGYAFSRGGLPERTIITDVNGVPVADLDAFQTEIAKKADGARVRLRYFPVGDPQRVDETVVIMDRRWHAMRRCIRDPFTGAWPCVDVGGEPQREPAAAATVAFPEASTRAGKAVARSLVQVDFDVPYPTTGIKASNYRGVGIVIDAKRGLVVCDRDTVPVRIGDIQLTFAGQLRVPASVVYLHPVHNLAVLEYDVSRLGDSDVQSAIFVDRDLNSGDAVWQVGLDSSGNMVEYATSVARTGAFRLGASRTPRFRDVNVEGFSLTDSLSSIGGVLTDKKGRIVAGWLSFMDQAKGEAGFRALPSEFLLRVIEPLRRGEDPAYRALGAELQPIGLADARERGLNEVWAARLLAHDAKRRKVLVVDRVWGATPAHGLLRNGDLILQVDGEPVTRMIEVERLTRRETLGIVVLRDGVEMVVDVPTVALDGQGIDRLVQWAGLIVHEPHLQVAAQAGDIKPGVYGSWIWYGTPAYDSRIRPTRHIVEIDGIKIADMDGFVQVIAGLEDRQAVRVTLEQLDGRIEVKTMKMDLQFWPTTEVRWEGDGWSRRELEAAPNPQ